MTIQPVGHAFAEWEVVQIAGELSHGTIGERNGIYEALIAHLPGPKQAYVKWGGLDVFQPAISPKITALNAKGNIVSRVLDSAADAGGELRGDALVGVEIKDPRVPEGEIGQSPILVSRPRVEFAAGDASVGRASNRRGSIGAAGVEDVNVVGPAYRIQTAGQILLFIPCEDEDRNHTGITSERRPGLPTANSSTFQFDRSSTLVPSFHCINQITKIGADHEN
jgi:hypothetical protein